MDAPPPGERLRAERVDGGPVKRSPRMARVATMAQPSPSHAGATSVAGLPGAGPATTARLVEQGLGTVGDVLSFVPRGYDDLRKVTPLAALAGKEEGSVILVRGTVTRVNVFPGRFLMVHLEDAGARLIARWFRVPAGMSRAFQKGQEVVLAGPLHFGADREAALSHPTNLTGAFAGTTAPEGGRAQGLGIRSRYAAVPGVAARVLERIIAAAVDRHASDMTDVLPPATRTRLGLPSIAESLRQIHLPDPGASRELLDALVAGRSDAHRRLAVEDLLVIQVGLALRRAEARRRCGFPCDTSAPGVSERIIAALPFELTGAQRRCIGEIQHDMAEPRPMQRLLVGDVGSGKTAVAFAAAAQAALSGGQTLLMAPTELLAEQHARTLGPWASRLGFRVGLLTASTPRPERESLLALGRAGQVAIVIGTQSLLADRVVVPALRLAIVDEQHRFGVAQRVRLRERNAFDTGPDPHLLVMTATPIPRTLAFTLYGDLDLSVLDEMPPGRTPVRTRVLKGEGARREAERAMRDAVAVGRRVFVVCPVREISVREGGVTALQRHRQLESTLAPARVGLVHGAMDARAKDATLRAFAAGRLDVLVATTVIEVGIDVPEASLMVVEEAERFGLAQLHQLRGRVGRGNDAAAPASECILVMGANAEKGAESSDAARRLAVVAATNDGFRIAQADLDLRGCGDLFGVRQAGLPRLRFPDLAGLGQLLDLCRGEATRVLEEDPGLDRHEHQPLRAAVERRWAVETFGEEAG